MSYVENIRVVEDTRNQCKDQCMMRNRNRRPKLTISMRRYSKKKACRERRRRLALQNTSVPSTSDGQRYTPEKIYLPLDEEIETANSKEMFEETTEELFEIEDTNNTEDGSNIEIITSQNEELVIQKTVMNEPETQSGVPSGLSIVDMQHIFVEFQKIGDHAKNREDCGIRHLKIIGMKRSGLRTTLSVMCDMCKYKGEIHSEPDESNKMETSQCAVAGTIVNGGSYAQMEEFLAAMNIPSMSKREFRKHHDKIVEALIVAAEEEMVAAAEEERHLAIERGDIVSGCGIPHIPVVADGSWMKRSYRSGTYDSASGVGVIIGYHTKKVLFIGVRNKVCKICRYAAKKKEEPRKHTCFKNWGTSQASTAMESDAIVEGFNTSVEKRGLIYSTLIADGDSSVYKKIIDADPYKTQIRVKKIECTNHLLRNFSKKMKEIVKKTKPGLLRKIVAGSIRRMRADIVKAAEFRYSQHVTTAEKIKNLYGDIHNIPSHAFGEHAECSKLQYFCDGTSKKDEKNFVPELMKMGVYERIKEILRPLLAHVDSLLYNSNNNAVESFNGIIAKYTGGKRLNFGERGSYTGRCAAAVVQYNTKQVLSRLNTAMNKKPPVILRKMENRRKKVHEKYAVKIKGKKVAKHVRKQFRSEMDPNYGPNAQKPDMAKNIYELEQKIHMGMLQNWQNRSDAIEKETIG
ncbi:uncharacterized protein LOC114881126 [Osmia bicornis bicornis]|uniref:uncharacterized protein LOC114881126 n=1 Tax=Osmia bicornis bicornis TaxID=1437191 RepID=UPI001EAF664C|nr:uncharacterized protein LOC114881126 [Osmia bicornis bicornis]XP_029053623.2 uncharacterized protein LOC114881126 [Osmia bicornis bicornis]